MIGAITVRRAGSLLLALFICTLPLEFTSVLLPLGGVDLPQVVLAVGLVGFGIAVLLGVARPRLPWTGSAGLVALLVVYAVVSALIFRPPSLKSALVPLLGYPLALALVYNLANDTARLRIAWISLLATAAGVSIVAIVLRASEQFIWRPAFVDGVVRVNATFADPDILARFVCLGVAAGLIFFAHERAPRARALAFAAVLLCAAVVPLTFSRAGVLLFVSALVAGIAAADVRRAAGMLGLIAAIVFCGVVATQPSARARVGNIFVVLASSLTSEGFGRPTLSFNEPGGGVPPTLRAKTCLTPAGMEVVNDKSAVEGNAMLIRTGAAVNLVSVFGKPTQLQAGNYNAYVRLKVDSNKGKTAEVHLGVYDPTNKTYVPGGYIDLAPSGFSDEYAWLEIGLFAAPDDPIEFRLLTLQAPSTDWHIDTFAVVPSGPPANRTEAALSGPWAPARAAATIDPTSLAVAAPAHIESDPLAIGGKVFKLGAGTPVGTDVPFGQPISLPAGRIKVYAHARTDRVTDSTAQVTVGFKDQSAALAAGGATAGAGTVGCTSPTWLNLGDVTIPAAGHYQLSAKVLQALPTAWAIDRVAIVPDATTSAELATRFLSNRQVELATTPWWEQVIYRLPLDDQRRYLMAAGIQMFIDHPLIGVGYGRYQVNLLTRYHGFIVPGYKDTLSHASLVTIAAELGLVGLLITFAAIVTLVREVRYVPGDRRRRIYVLVPGVLLLLVLIDSQFEARLFTEPYLWTFLALLYAARRAAVVEEPDRPFHLVMLTHYFPPEVGAPQSRLYELAVRLVRAGVRVTVVTGFPNYPTGNVAAGYRGKLFLAEDLDGVQVLRTWVIARPNRGFTLRLVNHFSFAVSSLIALPRLGPIDVLFIESPPLFLGLAGITYHLLTGAPYVFNVSDVWPQSAVELGALRNRVAIAAAKGLELLCYRWARYVTVVTRGILENLAARGVPRDRLFLLTNGVDTSFYSPRPRDPEVRALFEAEDQFVVLYAGTHGLAQGLDVILEAAKLVGDPDVLFVFVGEGAEKQALIDRAAADGIRNVRFVDNQPRRRMPEILSAADAAIIPLRPLELFRSALPSKMFEAMAAEKPIVLAVWGEAADVVGEAGCGITVEPGDAAGIAAAVTRLAGNRELAHRLGAAGRRHVGEHYDRDRLAARFLELIQAAAAPATGAPAMAPAATERAITQ